MRKRIAMFLTLYLLCGAVALAGTIEAEGGTASTIVTYDVPENKRFTVEIPSNVRFTSETNEGSMMFEVDAPEFNAPGWGVKVYLTGTDGNFTLTNGDQAVSYRMMEENGREIVAGAPALEWYFDDPHTFPRNKVWLIADPQGKPSAGTYQDMMTFLIRLVGPSGEG